MEYRNTDAVKRTGTCETCEFYQYDDYLEEDICTQPLDEDEVARLSPGAHTVCPYYRLHDEYKSVQRQI